MKQIRRHFTYANVMSSIAVFMILGGATAFAAVKKVGPNEIKANSIKTGKIVKEAVTAGKIKSGAVTESRLADGAVTTNKIADNAVTTGKIAKDAVTTEKIANDAVSSGKIANNAVTTTKIAANAVTQQKLTTDSVGSSQLKGLTLVSATSASTANNASVGVTATCPSGQVIAGGFETAGAGGSAWQIRRLLRDGNGWRVFAQNLSGGNSTISAFAYCLNE